MKAVKFKHSNKVLTSVQKDLEGRGIFALPIWTDGQQTVSCWRLSLRERLSALFFGRIWIAVLFGGTQPPISAAVARKYFEEVKGDTE